jgi:hypothetical protein
MHLRPLNVHASTVAVDSVLGRAARERLGSLLEDYTANVSTILSVFTT